MWVLWIYILRILSSLHSSAPLLVLCMLIKFLTMWYHLVLLASELVNMIGWSSLHLLLLAHQGAKINHWCYYQLKQLYLLLGVHYIGLIRCTNNVVIYLSLKCHSYHNEVCERCSTIWKKFVSINHSHWTPLQFRFSILFHHHNSQRSLLALLVTTQSSLAICLSW